MLKHTSQRRLPLTASFGGHGYSTENNR